MLEGKGLWKHVDKSAEPPSLQIDHSKFVQRRHMAAAILLMSIQDDVVTPVIDMDDPYEIWETRKGMFEQSTTAQLDGLLSQYHSVRMQPKETVHSR